MQKRIGLVIDYINNSAFQQQLFEGLEKAMSDRDCQLLVFNGGPAVEGPDEDLYLLNSVYGLINSDNLDGLLVSSTLASYTTPDKFKKFLARFDSIPTVLLGVGPDSVPQVTIDNKIGMETLIDHFIIDHGYKRIAFITGTRGYRYSEKRLEAYKSCLKKAGIPYDPRYVVNGYLMVSSGVKGVKTLIDERKLDFDAIICSNDHEAIGVSQEMERRGLYAPNDYALGGFDDTDLASSLFPGLTTVNQVLDSLCQKGLDVLFDRIEGRAVPPITLSPVKLVVRGTCGCSLASIETSEKKDIYINPDLPWKEIKTHLSRTIIRNLKDTQCKIDDDIIPQLLETLYLESIGGDSRKFIPEFEETLRVFFCDGKSLLPLKDVLTELKYAITPLLCNTEQQKKIEKLFYNARLDIEELEIIRKNKERQVLEEKYKQVIIAGNAIANSLDLESLIANLAYNVPRIGITEFFLAFYKDETLSHADVKLLMSEGRNIELNEKHFDCRTTIPFENTFKSNILFVCPLYNHERVLGYVAFNHLFQSDFVIWNIFDQLKKAACLRFPESN